MSLMVRLMDIERRLKALEARTAVEGDEYKTVIVPPESPADLNDQMRALAAASAKTIVSPPKRGPGRPRKEVA